MLILIPDIEDFFPHFLYYFSLKKFQNWYMLTTYTANLEDLINQKLLII